MERELAGMVWGGIRAGDGFSIIEGEA